MERLIKKYKNRRLYDTEKSQYITIEDLQRYVLDTVPFRVEDSATGKDITNATLMQILVETQAGATQFLSPTVLRQLITLANHPLSQSFKAAFENMLTLLEKQVKTTPVLQSWQDAVQKQWESLFRNQ